MSAAKESICLGLLGWPLAHSLSPVLHRAALAALDISGDYDLFPIPPLPEGSEALTEKLSWLREGRLLGLNVTLPHKAAVIALLDEVSPVVEICGAANTLYMQGGRMRGANTDAPAFLSDMKAKLGANLPPKGGQALALGAGGAARAVVYALLDDGWEVFVAARRLEQAQSLAADLHEKAPHFKKPSALQLSTEGLAGCRPDLIVNATSAGMLPRAESSPWPQGLPLPQGAALYDLVYNPRCTALMQAAQEAGLPVCGGMGMLVEQAALALETWLDDSAPRAAMLAALEKEALPDE